VPDPNLERVDPFASSLLIVEDPADVGDRACVPAVESEACENPAQESPGVGCCRHARDDSIPRFPNVGDALSCV
jgi:hypothetical protein